MKKFLAGTAIAGSLVAGSFGLAALNPMGIASAATTKVEQATGHHAHHPGLVRGVGRQIADKLGMTPKDLHAELKSGKTIAQVASEHGVDVSQLESDVVARIDARVDKAVANGKLTAEKGQNIKDKAPAKLDELANKVWGQAK